MLTTESGTLPASNQQRVNGIMQVVESVSMGDLSRRIDPGEMDWLGVLAVRLNMMIDDLEDALDNQSRKSREIAQVNEELTKRSDELQAQLDLITEQNELIRRQQYSIRELSTPVMQLWENVLAMPIIGVVDTKRSADIMERLLAEVTEKQSRYVILDITGVEVVDTKTADHFIKVIKAAELLGAVCMLTGIRPAVAQTLVEIGVDLSSIATLRNLQDGLRECLRQMARHDGKPARS